MIQIKILQVKYNNQCDNIAFTNLKPTAQCGYTSACMVLSYYIRAAENDIFLGEFVEYMDRDFLMGKSKTRMGSSLTNYPKVLNNYLKGNNIHKECKIRLHSGTDNEIQSIIDAGNPIMCSTMLTTSGHYIVIVGYDSENFIVHDPFGLFNFDSNGYLKIGGKSGEFVKYPREKLKIALERSSRVTAGKPGYRFLWIE